MEWIDRNPQALLYLTPAVVIGSLIVVFYLISQVGGWALLARRFRTDEAFFGKTWSWQSAQLRGWCNYNHCLTVGSNEEALYLSVAIPFRLFHPPLLIPWREIEVATGKLLFGFYDTALFRAGTDQRVRVRIYGRLVDRVREAAGPGWPLYGAEQMDRVTDRR